MTSQITEDFVLACSFSEQSLKEIESTQTTQETVPWVVWSLNGEQVSDLENSGAGVEQSDYIGQVYDESTQMSYLNARYYQGSRGQFISQDPVFWEVGITKDGQNALIDPQSMNSYSYGGNNPIKNSDPTGRLYKEFLTG